MYQKMRLLMCQDDLIRTVVLPHLVDVSSETDHDVRLKVLQLVTDLAESSDCDTFFDLINVLKKVCYLVEACLWTFQLYLGLLYLIPSNQSKRPNSEIYNIYLL
jgi:hypothetical protein